MTLKYALVVAMTLSILPLAGCGGSRPSREEMNASPSQKIAVLNHGYASLYSKTQELAKIHQLLRVKVQNEDTAKIIDDISSHGERLSHQLESLVKRYPSLSLRDEGQPMVADKKSDAIAHYYLKQMAPVVGRTGKDFERTILETQREELNQARFYARALASVERDANRRTLMKNAQKQLDDLYQTVADKLSSDYYVH